MKKQAYLFSVHWGLSPAAILEATHGHLTPQLPLPPFSAPVELFMLVAVCLLIRNGCVSHESQGAMQSVGAQGMFSESMRLK